MEDRFLGISGFEELGHLGVPKRAVFSRTFYWKCINLFIRYKAFFLNFKQDFF